MRLLIACLVLVVVVAALAIVAFPLGFLDGADRFWRYPKGDFAEHIIGGHYFIADAWRWPLLTVPDLGSPPGTNIGLTDSIPLAALLAKLLRHWYGYLRPYLPLWILLCYLLQGPACAIGLYVLGVRNLAALTLGGLLAVFSPVLLYASGMLLSARSSCCCWGWRCTCILRVGIRGGWRSCIICLCL